MKVKWKLPCNCNYVIAILDVYDLKKKVILIYFNSSENGMRII